MEYDDYSTHPLATSRFWQDAQSNTRSYQCPSPVGRQATSALIVAFAGYWTPCQLVNLGLSDKLYLCAELALGAPSVGSWHHSTQLVGKLAESILADSVAPVDSIALVFPGSYASQQTSQLQIAAGETGLGRGDGDLG